MIGTLSVLFAALLLQYDACGWNGVAAMIFFGLYIGDIIDLRIKIERNKK